MISYQEACERHEFVSVFPAFLLFILWDFWFPMRTEARHFGKSIITAIEVQARLGFLLNPSEESKHHSDWANFTPLCNENQFLFLHKIAVHNATIKL